MVDWTRERIAELSLEGVKNLRRNANRRGETAIIERCDSELAARAPVRYKSPRITGSRESHRGQVVIGYHFVCPREKGVTKNPDGTIWTGTWVVDKKWAERSSKIGAYVALHAARSEPSYLQGIVKDWRSAKRDPEYTEDRPVKIEYGVVFLLEPTNEPYQWKGDGSGEKGYVWSSEMVSSTSR
jgi:hypothetical protein